MTIHEFIKGDAALRMLLDNNPFPVAILDESNENVLYWSQSAQRLFGHSPKSVKEWYRLAYPDPEYLQEVLSRWTPMVEKAKASEAAINTGEYRIRCQDGTDKICELWVQHISASLIVTLHDITERKQALDEIVKQKNLANNYLNIVGSMIVALNREGKITLINKRGREILGYREGELDGKDWFSTCIPADRREDVQACFIQWMEGRELAPAEQESNVLRKDGTERVLRWFNKLVIDESGQVSGLLSSGQDVTEKRQGEESLRESEKRYKRLFENSPIGISMTTLEGEVRCNDAFCKTLGYTRGELKKIRWQQITHPDDIQKSEDVFKSLLAGEISCAGFEKRFLHKDGRVVWTDLLTFLERDKNNQPQYFITEIVDTTERKHAEKEIESQLQMLHQSESIANLGYFETHWQDNIGYWSPGFIKLLGIKMKPEAFSIQDFIQYIFEDDREDLLRHVQSSLTDHTPLKTEFRVIQEGGDVLHLVGLAENYYDEYDLPLVTKGVIQNITDQKRAESELKKALETARTANNVKDQFIANISHEIRTPLNAIIGFSDLFRQRYDDLIRDTDKKIFQYLDSASDRLMRTVDSILSVSQLKAGNVHIVPSVLDLNGMIQAVIDEIKSQAEEKGLDLSYKPLHTPAMVKVDEYSIHHAILNIAENAIKYTIQGKIQLKLISKEHCFKLSIQDTGIGISKEYQELIYDPYTQESEGFTKNYQGIGLGLALAKRYLELNDVDIELESEKGVGTTFTLIFSEYRGD